MKISLSRDELRESPPAGKVDEQSRLCQSYKVTREVREFSNSRQNSGP